MSIKKHFAKKRFGQNFLIDDTIISKIFSSINLSEDDHVLEIGPGLGALTNQLANKCKHLDLVEIDRDLCAKLQQNFKQYNNVKIYQQDILKFDLTKIATENKKIRVIGNLPYNISTPLIFKLIQNKNFIKDMHFMLQKEVADRLNAVPKHNNYGRLSVMVQYSCKVIKLINVPPKAFEPAPLVQSAFVRIIPHETLPLKANNFDSFMFVTRLAFSQRRKTIYNALKEHISKEAFNKLEIEPKMRAQELEVADFIKISNYFDEKNRLIN